MQKMLVLAALLALLVLGLAPQADAQRRVGLRIGDRDRHASINIGFGSPVRGHRPMAIPSRWARPVAPAGHFEPGHYETVYQQVWTPAEYRTVRCGYGFMQVLAHPAGYRTVETRVWVPARWVPRRPVCF